MPLQIVKCVMNRKYLKHRLWTGSVGEELAWKAWGHYFRPHSPDIPQTQGCASVNPPSHRITNGRMPSLSGQVTLMSQSAPSSPEELKAPELFTYIPPIFIPRDVWTILLMPRTLIQHQDSSYVSGEALDSVPTTSCHSMMIEDLTMSSSAISACSLGHLIINL